MMIFIYNFYKKLKGDHLQRTFTILCPPGNPIFLYGECKKKPRNVVLMKDIYPKYNISKLVNYTITQIHAFQDAYKLQHFLKV